MATVKISYDTSAALTWSGAIASSTTVCRESNAINNTTSLYDDVRVFISIVYPNLAPANDKTVYILAGGYLDATIGWAGSPALTGLDAAWTADADLTANASGLKVAGAFWQVQNKTRVFEIPSLATVFGGSLPVQIGLVCWNFSGQTITTFSARYQGIYYTVA